MLQFSPTEVKRCQEALARERPEPIVDPAATSSVDGLSGWASWAFGSAAEEQKLPSRTTL